MAYSESVGSIRNQIGRSLNIIQMNIEQEDLAGVSNQVRLLKAKLSVYFSPGKSHCASCGVKKTGSDRDEYDGITPATEDDRNARFEACMIQLEYLLQIATRHKIYARPSRKVGNAAHLALTDGDDWDEEDS